MTNNCLNESRKMKLIFKQQQVSKQINKQTREKKPRIKYENNEREEEVQKVYE